MQKKHDEKSLNEVADWFIANLTDVDKIKFSDPEKMDSPGARLVLASSIRSAGRTKIRGKNKPDCYDTKAITQYADYIINSRLNDLTNACISKRKNSRCYAPE